MIYRFKGFNNADLNVDKLFYRRYLTLGFIDKTVFLNPLNTDKSIKRYKQYLFICLSLEG